MLKGEIKMLKKAIIFGIVVSMGMSLWADFSTDFQSALKLYNEVKNKEAQAAFEKLAAAAPTPKSKAECLSYAAKTIARDTTQYSVAIEKAKKIEIKGISATTQMSIMQDNSKLAELFDAFKDEDFSTWPDAYQQPAYTMRGNAASIIGQSEAAKKDLTKAIELAGSDLQAKIIAMGALNDLYTRAKDYDNVITTSKQIFEMKEYNGFWPYLMAVFHCSNAQLAQGKFDDALATLKLIEHMKEGMYKCEALIIYGDIYLAQGKKDDAAAKYKEAAGMNGASEVSNGLPAVAQKRLQDMGR
jgi:predicted negative regulator of RcsB-dependent stress response